jgi:hypothetical protein
LGCSPTAISPFDSSVHGSRTMTFAPAPHRHVERRAVRREQVRVGPRPEAPRSPRSFAAAGRSRAPSVRTPASRRASCRRR